MEQKSTSIMKSSLVYAVYLAIFFIIISVIFYVANSTFSKTAQYVGYVVTILAVVVVQLNYRKSLGGFMTYGQGLGIAIVPLFFAGIIVAVYTYLLFTVIDAELINQLHAMTEEQMLQRGMPEEQLDAALSMSKKFQNPLMMTIMTPIMYTISGLIVGLITSIFTKKTAKEEITE